jgi:cysteine desulfurase/selenocysteine lyase
MIFNPQKIRKDFPLYKYNKGLVYLDSAATSLTPSPVIDSIQEYYKKYNANVHRGVYQMSILATEMYERAHRVVADFLGADAQEIVFNAGATMGINQLAYGLEDRINEGDVIVLTRLEHHANLIPWQQLAKRKNAQIRYLELTDAYTLDEASLDVIDSSVKIVSVAHVSNTLGTILPVKRIIEKAHEVGALAIVDASQSVPHMRVNVKELDCDFLVFSGHKVLGPTGIGVLYGKISELERLQPAFFGGAMIDTVTYEDAIWAQVPERFEAGTPNISAALGLAAALGYINEIGMHNIEVHQKNITRYALEKLHEIPGLQIIGPQGNEQRIGVISFVIEGMDSSDIGTLLDQQGVAVRTGHHCTQPLLTLLDVPSTVRASLYFYNSNDEIDALVRGLYKAIGMLQE